MMGCFQTRELKQLRQSINYPAERGEVIVVINGGDLQILANYCAAAAVAMAFILMRTAHSTSTHSPSGITNPVSSATAIKSPGGIAPRVG